ncbi:putative inner membrane transport protein [Klebsiella pneumoniae]|nr:putative inner membrane transport protein [Klebsiella pneumoniae]
MAGQAVTATALVALVTGLLIATATRNIDRRWVLMFFSVLQIVSSLMVAFADSLAFLLLGRLLLGIAIGGFWAMSTATAMRLVPAAHVPKALAIIFSAVSVATVVAAPLGSYLGELIGWRNVFILCAIPSLLALLWQLWVLPSMRPESVGDLLHAVQGAAPSRYAGRHAGDDPDFQRPFRLLYLPAAVP